MKSHGARIPKLAVVALCLFSTSCAARMPLGEDAEAVRTVEVALRDAFSSNVVDVLDYHLADDYVHTNYRGMVRTNQAGHRRRHRDQHGHA